MHRNMYGVYYFILPIREIENGKRYNSDENVYRYKFLVDGIWTYDRTNKNRVDDGLGSYLSEFRTSREDINQKISVRIIKEKINRVERLVEFAVYLPDVKNLSLVGSFNNWNPEHDLPVKNKRRNFSFENEAQAR